MAIQYQDRNGDGIPDAFEQRRSITDTLSDVYGPDTPSQQPELKRFAHSWADMSTVMEIENQPRPPLKGEMFFCAGKIEIADHDYAKGKYLIVRRIFSGDGSAVGKGSSK